MFHVSVFGFRVSRFRSSGFGSRVSGFGVSGFSGFGVRVSGFGVSGVSGFRFRRDHVFALAGGGEVAQRRKRQQLRLRERNDDLVDWPRSTRETTGYEPFEREKERS